MFVKPHVPPWLPEGKHQQILGVERVCDIAKRLLVDSYDVVIADVLSDDTARLYRKRLADFEPRIVQLLPSFEIVRERFYARGPVLTDEEFEFVYREQELFTDYDIRIDNSGLSPDEAVVEILS